jgi:hypothetical protein
MMMMSLDKWVGFEFHLSIDVLRTLFCSVATFGLEQVLIQNRIGYSNGRWVHDFFENSRPSQSGVLFICCHDYPLDDLVYS